MRHRVDHRKLGRTRIHRKALMRSMVTSLFDSERITTTAPKAKEARRVAEKLITRAKKGQKAHDAGQTGVGAGTLARAREQSFATPSCCASSSTSWLRISWSATAATRASSVSTTCGSVTMRRLVMLELVDTEKTKKPMIRGAVAAAAEEATAKGVKGKEKADADAKSKKEAKPKKEKKAEAPKVAKEKPGKPAKTKADTKKKDSGAKRSAPKKSG